MKRAFFFFGGWEGHEPEAMAKLFAARLRDRDFEVDMATSLDGLEDAERLKEYDLLFPCWTMGTLSREQTAGLTAAVRSGVGLAGIHGGMGDAFRGNLEYEWMAGGHFVGHPHVGDYTVQIKDPDHPVTQGLPRQFGYRSEQYYLMVDPGIHVLAETDYSREGQTLAMPVAWTKRWGAGRVFYSSLGHVPAEFFEFPVAFELALRGLAWAARER